MSSIYLFCQSRKNMHVDFLAIEFIFRLKARKCENNSSLLRIWTSEKRDDQSIPDVFQQKL